MTTEPDYPCTCSPRRWRTVVIVVVLVAAAVATWKEVLEDRIIPKRWGTVVAGSIYRSGQLHPALIRRELEENHIDLVVCLRADEPDNPAHEAELEASEALHVQHLVLPLSGDGTGDIEMYARAVAAMVDAERHGQRTLVHCAAGTYRTGGVVAVYRMFVEGWTPEQARAEMVKYDWNDDNPILPDYLNAHMAELAQRLVELGVIDAVPDPLPRL